MSYVAALTFVFSYSNFQLPPDQSWVVLESISELSVIVFEFIFIGDLTQIRAQINQIKLLRHTFPLKTS